MSSFGSRSGQSHEPGADEPGQGDRPRPEHWLQPPPLTLGSILPMNQELARTPRGVVALVEIRAFPTGCRFEVVAAVERPQDEAVLQQLWRLYAVPRDGARAAREALLDVGVLLPDGSTASILERVVRQLAPGAEPPDPPVLTVRSGRVSEVPDGSWLQVTLDLWLWPLPPPEPFQLTLAHPLIDLPETHVEIDGAAIASAAARSRALIT